MKSFLNKEINSFKNAFNGIKLLISSERHFQYHILAVFLTILVNLILGISKSEWLVILLCFAIVLSTEAINTSLEKMLDVIHPARANWVKEAKDIAAASVLISSLISFIIALIIWIPKIME